MLRKGGGNSRGNYSVAINYFYRPPKSKKERKRERENKNWNTKRKS